MEFWYKFSSHLFSFPNKKMLRWFASRKQRKTREKLLSFYFLTTRWFFPLPSWLWDSGDKLFCTCANQSFIILLKFTLEISFPEHQRKWEERRQWENFGQKRNLFLTFIHRNDNKFVQFVFWVKTAENWKLNSCPKNFQVLNNHSLEKGEKGNEKLLHSLCWVF